jgi:hypothetical protein
MDKKIQKTAGDFSPEAVQAFEATWFYYPAPVFLLHRNRDIIAMNKAAKDLGILTGMKCFQLSGAKGIHNNCLGNAALREQTGKRSVMYVPQMKQVLDSYWLPVVGEKNLLIHFAADITEYAKPELFPPDELNTNP